MHWSLVLLLGLSSLPCRNTVSHRDRGEAQVIALQSKLAVLTLYQPGRLLWKEENDKDIRGAELGSPRGLRDVSSVGSAHQCPVLELVSLCLQPHVEHEEQLDYFFFPKEDQLA